MSSAPLSSYSLKNEAGFAKRMVNLSSYSLKNEAGFQELFQAASEPREGALVCLVVVISV